MPELSVGRTARMRHAMRLRLISPRLWLRHVVFWVGAVLVAVIAIGFAAASNEASALFAAVTGSRPWLALIITPAGLMLSVMLTQRVFRGAQGSGIPQTIAAI